MVASATVIGLPAGELSGEMEGEKCALAHFDEVKIKRGRFLQPRQGARAKERAVSRHQPVLPPVDVGVLSIRLKIGCFLGAALNSFPDSFFQTRLQLTPAISCFNLNFQLPRARRLRRQTQFFGVPKRVRRKPTRPSVRCAVDLVRSQVRHRAHRFGAAFRPKCGEEAVFTPSIS
jgi:hypothetical protein